MLLDMSSEADLRIKYAGILPLLDQLQRIKALKDPSDIENQKEAHQTWLSEEILTVP